MLSHDNLGFRRASHRSTCGFEGIEAGRDVLSVLPYSHIYEHTVIYIYLLASVRYFICHDPNELLADLRDVRPADDDRGAAHLRPRSGRRQGPGAHRRRPAGKARSVGARASRARGRTRTTFGRVASPVARASQYAVAKRLVLEQDPPARSASTACSSLPAEARRCTSIRR